MLFINVVGMTINSEGEYTELRKVQITGKSSYTIVLPKKWIENNSVKKGDLIALNIVNEELILTKVKEPEKKKEKPIPKIIIDDISDSALIFLIQSAYTEGLDCIELLSTKKKMDSSRKAVAVDAIQELIGFEVVLDSGDSIVVKNILEPSDFKIKDVGDRLHKHIWDMYEIVINSVIEKNLKVVEDIETRKKMVNRLCLLTQRLLTIGVGDRAIARKIGLNSRDAIYWSNIIKILSRNSDIYLEMAQQVKYINSMNIPNELLDFFKWLADLLPSLKFKDYNMFTKEGVFEMMKVYDGKYDERDVLLKIEEMRRMLSEKSLNPKLRLHIENLISLLQNLFKNCFEYTKTMISAVYWEYLK